MFSKPSPANMLSLKVSYAVSNSASEGFEAESQDQSLKSFLEKCSDFSPAHFARRLVLAELFAQYTVQSVRIDDKK